MLSGLIDQYRSMRRQKSLDRLTGWRHSYAAIGAGRHSTENLYPCIRQLNVPLRYICTKTAGNAEKMAVGFPGAKGITSLGPILDDPTVKGVFVCAPPLLQEGFVKALLQ